MKKTIKKLILLMVIMALCCSAFITASAHSLLIESLGGSYVSFCYSDGTPCKGAKIFVKDADGNDLGTGKTNSKGIYDYAEYVGQAATITMNDGEGHVGTYDVPAELPPVTDRTPVSEAPAAAPAETPAEAPAGDTAAAETPAPAVEEPEAKPSSSMSGGTITAIVIVVVAAVAIAVLFSKKNKKK